MQTAVVHRGGSVQAGVGGAAAVLAGLADDDKLSEESGCEQP